jgi:hypothetical protein
LLPAIAEDAESCISLSSDADAAVSTATHPVTRPTAYAHHGVLKKAIKKCADPGSAPAYHANPRIAIALDASTRIALALDPGTRIANALDPGTIFEREATHSGSTQPVYASIESGDSDVGAYAT